MSLQFGQSRMFASATIRLLSILVLLASVQFADFWFHGAVVLSVAAIAALVLIWPGRFTVVSTALVLLGCRLVQQGIEVKSLATWLIIGTEATVVVLVYRHVVVRFKARRVDVTFVQVFGVLVALSAAIGLLQTFTTTLWPAAEFFPRATSFMGLFLRYWLVSLSGFLVAGFLVSVDPGRRAQHNPLQYIGVALLVVSLGLAGIGATNVVWANQSAAKLKTGLSEISLTFNSNVSTAVSNALSELNNRHSALTASYGDQLFAAVIGSNPIIDGLGYYAQGRHPGAVIAVGPSGRLEKRSVALGMDSADGARRAKVLRSGIGEVVGIRYLANSSFKQEANIVFLEPVLLRGRLIGILSVAVSLPATLQRAVAVAPVQDKILTQIVAGGGHVVASVATGEPVATSFSYLSLLSFGQVQLDLSVRAAKDFGLPARERRAILAAEAAATLALAVTALRVAASRRRAQEILTNRDQVFTAALSSNPDRVAIVKSTGDVLFTNHSGPPSRQGLANWSELLPYAVSAVEFQSIESMVRSVADSEIKKMTIIDAQTFTSPRYYDVTVRPLGVQVDATDVGLLSIADATDVRNAEIRDAQLLRLESLSAMARGLVHDFNNLLFIITGYLGKALEAPSVNSDTDTHTAITRAVDAAQRGTRIADSLLTVAGGRRLDSLTISMKEFLAEFVPLAQQALGSRNELHVTDHDANLATRVDVSQLISALLNLVINARDASSQGAKIQIDIDVAPTASLPPELERRPYVRFTVRDSGSGIEPDVAMRVFDPYFTTKPRGSGSGLGLATVKSFAVQSGGTITLDSVVGVGSTFTLYLPVATVVNDEVAADPLRSTFSRVVRRILVVDDERSLGELLASWLLESGFEAQYESSPEAALEHFASFGPDLVITDMEMGSPIDGLELVSRLLFKKPELEAIFMTGFTDRIATLQARGVPVLVKPFRREELMMILERLTSVSEVIDE